MLFFSVFVVCIVAQYVIDDEFLCPSPSPSDYNMISAQDRKSSQIREKVIWG